MSKPASKAYQSVWPKCSFFAIYDGHGGNACSDFLKDHLHNIILSQETFPSDPA
jgi:protein phosphatase 2C family protein 2/3